MSKTADSKNIFKKGGREVVVESGILPPNSGPEYWCGLYKSMKPGQSVVLSGSDKNQFLFTVRTKFGARRMSSSDITLEYYGLDPDEFNDTDDLDYMYRVWRQK